MCRASEICGRFKVEQSHLLGFHGQFREGEGGHFRVREEHEQSAAVDEWRGWC